MEKEKLIYKSEEKISDEDLLDFCKELENVYEAYLREKEEKEVRDLLLLNELYNSMMEIKRILRIRKVENTY